MAKKARTVSQTDLKALVGRQDDETFRLWRQEGCPHQIVNGRPRYVVAGVVAWLEKRAEVRSRPEDFEEARKRKMGAEAELAELELAQKRGQLIPLEQHGQRLARILERIRARLIALPGTLASRLVAIETAAEAQAVVYAGVAEALEELSRG